FLFLFVSFFAFSSYFLPPERSLGFFDLTSFFASDSLSYSLLLSTPSPSFSLPSFSLFLLSSFSFLSGFSTLCAFLSSLSLSFSFSISFFFVCAGVSVLSYSVFVFSFSFYFVLVYLCVFFFFFLCLFVFIFFFHIFFLSGLLF